MERMCYVQIPGKKPGQRMGIVKFYESGYYPCDFDNVTATDAEVTETVNELNDRLGVPREVAGSAADGSMFGWHVPAAQPAIEWFKSETLREADIVANQQR